MYLQAGASPCHAWRGRLYPDIMRRGHRHIRSSNVKTHTALEVKDVQTYKPQTNVTHVTASCPRPVWPQWVGGAPWFAWAGSSHPHPYHNQTHTGDWKWNKTSRYPVSILVSCSVAIRLSTYQSIEPSIYLSTSQSINQSTFPLTVAYLLFARIFCSSLMRPSISASVYE